MRDPFQVCNSQDTTPNRYCYALASRHWHTEARTRARTRHTSPVAGLAWSTSTPADGRAESGRPLQILFPRDVNYAVRPLEDFAQVLRTIMHKGAVGVPLA